MQKIETIFLKQTSNRWSISKSTFSERTEKLKRLKNEILKRREDIKEALYNDFKKPYAESELTEIHTSLEEINFALKNLKKWMTPKRVSTPMTLFGSRSEIHYEARGVVLILSPWNYPFSLLIHPLVAAIAAGNCIIAKPSEKTPHTATLLQEIMESIFSLDEVALVLGDVTVAEKLLELPFDHIFFTGSTSVGKKIMLAAAKNLATVTLELGGKSPVILDRIVDLEDAVEKIAWGKFLNGGQTCVAPDYVFVPEELKPRFIELFKIQIIKYYGDTEKKQAESQDFARLIDQRSFKRLDDKLKKESLLSGFAGLPEQNYLPPTVIESVLDSTLMEEEIFGPILPVITYIKIEEVINYLQSQSRPLALYLFSKQREFINNLLCSTTSGGVVVNNVVLHLANSHLPFGGVGHSGQGSYHGHFGFKAFSHERSVLRQGRFSLISFYFPPYGTVRSKLAFKLLRFLE